MGSPAPVTEFEVNTKLIRNVLKQAEDRGNNHSEDRM